MQALHRKNITPPTCEQLASTKKGEGLFFLLFLLQIPMGIPALWPACGASAPFRAHPFRSWHVWCKAENVILSWARHGKFNRSIIHKNWRLPLRDGKQTKMKIPVLFQVIFAEPWDEGKDTLPFREHSWKSSQLCEMTWDYISQGEGPSINNVRYVSGIVWWFFHVPLHTFAFAKNTNDGWV